MYERLRERYGHRNWWPGNSAFEVIVGAILTQNTAWRNVKLAIANLRASRLLSVSGLRRVPVGRLAALVRPSGYFRQKAKRLKAFVAFLDRDHAGRVAAMRREDPSRLRDALLRVHGVGPETADSILLYALKRPVFVVDAYTRRVLERHRIVRPGLGYEEIRAFLETRVPREVPLWNDFHAQFVAVGHHHCGPTPRCAGCPLEALIPPGGIRREAKRAARPRRARAPASRGPRHGSRGRNPS